MVSTKYRRKEVGHEERNTCLCCEEMQEKEGKSEGGYVHSVFPLRSKPAMARNPGKQMSRRVTRCWREWSRQTPTQITPPSTWMTSRAAPSRDNLLSTLPRTPRGLTPSLSPTLCLKPCLGTGHAQVNGPGWLLDFYSHPFAEDTTAIPFPTSLDRTAGFL